MISLQHKQVNFVCESEHLSVKPYQNAHLCLILCWRGNDREQVNCLLLKNVWKISHIFLSLLWIPDCLGFLITLITFLNPNLHVYFQKILMHFTSYLCKPKLCQCLPVNIYTLNIFSILEEWRHVKVIWFIKVFNL